MPALRIHLLGASGSGTTTLGRALASRFALPFTDSDDLFWEKTEPPYTTKNPRREAELAAALRGQSWILSGSALGWGDFLRARFTHVIFLALDPGLRLARLRERETFRYGARISPDGDMHRAHLDFLEWAAGYDHAEFAGRSRAVHEKWLRNLACPVLRISGTLSTAEQISSFERALEPLAFTVESAADAAPLVDPFYAALARPARARPGDVFFVARSAGDVIGCVRYCEEEGARLLRSMLVAERARGHGVGSALLAEFEKSLASGGPVFCVPYAHLESFYARVGFRRVEEAPAFLQSRLFEYRANGQDVILMRRQ